VPDPDFTVTDRNESGWLIMDSGLRRGYLISQRIPDRMVIQSVDLDTLRLGRRAYVDGWIPMPGGSGQKAGQVVHAVDPARHRIFIALSDTPNNGETGPSGDSRPPFRRILVMDEAKFEAGADDWRRDMDPPGADLARIAGHSLHGLTFVDSSAGGSLLLQLGATNAPFRAGLFDHWLLKWNATSGASEWSLLLRECSGAPFRSNDPAGAFPLELVVTAETIHLVCRTNSGAAQVVGIPLLDGAPHPTRAAQVSSPLPRLYADALADPGGHRLLLKALTGGETWWVYDTELESWAGAIGILNHTGFPSAAGVDQATGRFYSLIPDTAYAGRDANEQLPARGGLLESDARLTPAPQAINVEPSLNYPGVYRIQVDPAVGNRPRRLWIRRGSPQLTITPEYPSTKGTRLTPVEDHYLVVEDKAPVATSAAADNLDQYTIDKPERPGATGVNYAGSAGGYGARVRLVGGIPAATSWELSGLSSASACIPADREVTAGLVTDTEVSNIAVRARALPLALDPTTAADAKDPQGRCQSNGSSTHESSGQPGLGDAEVVCSGSGERHQLTVENEAPRQGSAKAECGADGQAAKASARHAIGLGPPLADVTIQDASTETSVRREPGVGMVTTVISVAKGIEIQGVLSIGLVRSEATTVAGGRRKSASTTFTRTICGIEGSTVGGSGCSADPATSVSLINQALGTRGQARLPEPDPLLRKGSPGGYIAAIQKSTSAEFSDSILNRDSSKAVPALEIVLYNDDPIKGAGRRIVQLAGLEASSTYGIYDLSGGSMPTATGGSALDGGMAANAVAGQAPGSLTTNDRVLPGEVRVRNVRSAQSPISKWLFGRPLLIRSLLEGLLAAAVWLVMGLPLYFAHRRQAFASAFFGGEGE
jgi:hypothetical protein